MQELLSADRTQLVVTYNLLSAQKKERVKKEVYIPLSGFRIERHQFFCS